MIKKLLKFAISLAAIKWLLKKMSHHHGNNEKTSGTSTAKLKR